MSKPSTSALKNPPQLSNKSAWAKGPPSASLASPRSQSPAPSAPPPPSSQPTHHRRPSALGQGVPIKDGVSIPRSNVGSVKQGTGVTFGSIDDDSAPISSSPTPVPAIKSEGPKSFGSVPVTASHVNGKASISSSAKPPPSSASMASTSSAIPSSSSTTSAASTPPPSTPATPVKTKPKMDVRQLFKGTGSSSSASTPQDSSPATRSAPLPSSQSLSHSSSNPSSSPQLSHLGTHPPAPFVPRQQQQQNGGPNGSPYPMPRSPVNSRHPQNGVGPRPSGSNGGPPPMGSPRMAPNQQHPGQPTGLPQQHVTPWPGYPAYYYPGVPEYGYNPGWYMPQHQMPPHQQHHPPPPGPPGPQHAGMPMSPRNAPPSLPAPGTPTPSHVVPISPHIPPATPAHSHSASISSQPPSTPMSASGPSGVRLNTNANAFVPNRKVTIKSVDGTELKLENLRKPSPTPAAPPSSPGSFSSNRKSIVRLESEDARKKRIAEEQEQEEKAKLEKQKEEELKKKTEEAEREKQKKKEDEERQRKEETERQERLKKEEAERERLRVEEEKRKEEEKLEKERLRKEEEEKERVRKEQEEKERKRKEEEAAKAAQADREAKAAEEAAAAKAKADDKSQLEDGEVAEDSADNKAPQESKEKSSEKESLRIDTTKASMPPPSEAPRRRPGPLDLSSASKMTIPAPLPSALATARIIDDINSVPYPKGIMSPKIELNENAKDGKFRYDRDFLLQFMSICKEKPDMLPPLDAIGLEPSEQGHPMIRGGSGRHRTSSTSQAPSASRTNSMGFGSGIKSGGQNPFVMGGIGMIGKLSSEERFAMSNRSTSVGGAAAVPSFGRPAMQRTASQGGGGGGGHPPGRDRVRSQRGKKRGDNEKSGLGQQSQMGGNSGHSGATGLGITGMEPVAPLEKSQNAWAPNSLGRRPAAVDSDSPEIVDRKVKGLLNKLTMEKFDSISDQIITWANKSEKEKDGRTLIQVIRLVFEKATDEAAWSEMYARLCRKMMEQISTQVQDDGIKNSEGKPIAGGNLFRKYLLNRCQEDFERGWNAKEMAASAAASKAASDQAVKAANEKTGDNEENGEVALYSEEYYAAQKAKRQGLGLIKFIGELFKLQMLTERIMHECVKKLLGNVENPEEEEIESLCKLLSTVGAILDNNQKARAHMDIYFTRMKELAKGQHVTSRMQFMLQDVIELRERKWVTRNKEATPTTLAAVHEQAKIQAEAQRQQHPMSRGGSKRGQERGDGFTPGADGWTNVSSNAPPRPTGKVGDLSQFGKISKGGPMTFGPSSVFSKKDVKRESLSRTSSSSNMFHMLQSADAAADPATLKSSRPPSRKPSADFSQTGLPEAAPQRRRLVLQPRTKATDENETTPAPSQPASEDEEDVPSKSEMSEADAQKKIKEDLKEFVAVRNLDEAEDYFTSLPSSHHHLLVDKLTSFACESKEADAQLVADLFARASSKSLCTSESFIAGFEPVVEIIEDIAIDAPKAFNYLALMIKGSGLSEDERTRLASKSSDSDRLLGLF